MNKYKYAAAAVLLLAAFFAGKYSVNPDVITHTVTTEGETKEKIITIEVRPDGTKTTTNVERVVTEKSKEKEKVVVAPVAPDKTKYSVSVSVVKSDFSPAPNAYLAEFGYRIFSSPIWMTAGVLVQAHPAAMVGLRMEW